MAVTKIDARPQPKTPKKKVAAYARVSTDNLDQKESLDAQKKQLYFDEISQSFCPKYRGLSANRT